ncbi:MAG: C25 family cysteine peptidase [Candidatus Electryonea clarkiae]|nr:C25 family cysteine peptidase [Candidatus Electryonea clarkiae]MDP8285144.1 C25 family cysteine peptidase [Candidatus Electryonea clarkiae]
MKKYILILIAVLAVSIASGQINFVTTNTADLVVITHDNLRTPNWYPGLVGAWETKLLDQKAFQDLTVGILQYSDNDDQDDIKTDLTNNHGVFEYVLILGDARRDITDPVMPIDVEVEVAWASNQIIPTYRTEHELEEWLAEYDTWVIENDWGYISNLEGVSIGRIPADSRQDIIDYITKSDIYLGENNPEWSDGILELMDDEYNAYNNCSGGNVRYWMRAASDYYPNGWSVSRLATSEHDNWNQTSRSSNFLSQINNNTPGYITVLGTSGYSSNLAYWYKSSDGYTGFTNSTEFPFILGQSCDIGGFQQWKWDDIGETYYELVNNLVEMLLLDDGGIIGAMAPTSYTLQTPNGIIAENFWENLQDPSVYTFGDLAGLVISSSKEKLENHDFIADMTVLLGDPSLPALHNLFQDDITISSNTTWDQPYVFLSGEVTVSAGVTLTISPGTHVVVKGGGTPKNEIKIYGKLVAEGTSSNRIIFESSNSNRWGGIKLMSGSSSISNIEYCDINDGAFGIYCETTLNSPKKIYRCNFDNCNLAIYFDGGNACVEQCDFVGGSRGIHTQDNSITRGYEDNDFDGQSSCAIYGNNALVLVTGCDIINSLSEGIYLTGCDDAIIHTTDISDVGHDGIAVRNSDDFYAYYCNIESASYSGIYLYKSGGAISYCQTLENGKSGIECIDSSPTINRSNLVENDDHGLYNLGTSIPSLTYYNHLQDNTDYQIYMMGDYKPYIDNCHNNIYTSSNDRLLIRSGYMSYLDYACEDNYWGSDDPDPYELFHNYNPAGWTNYEYIYPAETPFDNGINYYLIQSDDDDSLSAAFTAEGDGEWSTAARLFSWVYDNTEDTEEQSVALLHWNRLIVSDSTGWDDRLDTLLIMQDDLDDDSPLQDVFGSEIARALVGTFQYEDAIDIYVERYENGEDILDSALAEIHIGETYLTWAEAEDPLSGMNNKRGGSPSAAKILELENLELQLSILPTVTGSDELKPESRSGHEERVDEILSMLEKGAAQDDDVAIPAKFSLHQNYPNPFNPTTVLRFDLPKSVHVQLTVYNVLGQQVMQVIDQQLQAGFHSRSIDFSDMASGLYFYTIKAGEFEQSKKMIILK